MTIFRPITSLNVGHRITPSIMPRGYAEDNDPKDAPSGSSKCFPRAGCIGEAIVKPRRLRNEARSTAGTERSLPLIMFDNNNRKRDAGCFVSFFVHESCAVASYNIVDDCLLVKTALSTLFLQLCCDARDLDIETVDPNDRL